MRSLELLNARVAKWQMSCCYERAQTLALTDVRGCCCILTRIVLTLYCIYNMDNLIEIQFDYTYYSKNRKTPSFIDNDDLLALSYDFYSRMLSEVPHIAKVSAMPSEQLRLILVEESRPEIDLSPKYFKLQMMNKGVKTITIRVVASESPLFASKFVTSKEPASKFEIESNIRSKRRLVVEQ